MIKPLENEEEYLECLEIAKKLREWFNEAGIKAIMSDLRTEKTLIAFSEEVLGFIR